MRISLIVAMADTGIIGADNAIPWRLPADMKYFKQVTLGKPVIMGRKTFESLGRPLPGRTNIVISRNPDFKAEGAHVVADFDAALALAHGCETDEAMVIGGGEIYALALPVADRIYLTEVHGMVEGDTRFPPLDRTTWREVSRDFLARGQGASHDCSFVILERANKA